MHGAARRRNIIRAGRAMQIRRRKPDGTYATTDFVGFPHPASTVQQERILAGDLGQVDGVIETMFAEFEMANIAPRNGDEVVLDGRTVSVLLAWPVYDGPIRIGYAIPYRGGG